MNLTEQFAQAEMVTAETMSQDTAQLIERIQIKDLTESELEQLPFGAIELDTAGSILRYNGFESRLSGIHRNRALGKALLHRVRALHEREGILRALSGRRGPQAVARKFRYHFSFQEEPHRRHHYTFLQRPDGQHLGLRSARLLISLEDVKREPNSCGVKPPPSRGGIYEGN